MGEKAWDKLEEYVRNDPDVVKKDKGAIAKKSVIHEVAKTMVKSPDKSSLKPVEFVIAHGADVDSTELGTDGSEHTPAEIIAQGISDCASSDSAAPLKKVLKTLVVNYDAELKKVSKILGKEVVEKMKHEKPSKFKDKAAWHYASTAYYKHEHRVKYVRALINMATYQKKVDAEAARRISETAERGRGMTKHKRI